MELTLGDHAMSHWAKFNSIFPLFRNKRFALNEMFQRNASKFAISYAYENPHSFLFFISCNFTFYLNIDQGIECV